MKTNLLTIQMGVYLISMVDPWFPISMNKAKRKNLWMRQKWQNYYIGLIIC